MKQKIALTIGLCAFISGCGEPEKNLTFDQDVVSLEQACEAHSDFCSNYKTDSMCRNERKDFLEGYYYFRKNPKGKNAFSMLMLTRQYTDCAGKAKLIEYIPADKKYPLPEEKMSPEDRQAKIDYQARISRLKADKESNYRNAMIFLKETEKMYSGYQTPHLLAYQWKFKSNAKARDALFELYEAGKINDIDMEFLVIGTFARFEPERGVKDLLSLLKKYPKNQYFPKEKVDEDPTLKMAYDDLGVLHFDIFRQLTGLYFEMQDFERSFIFALLLEMNNDVTANTQMILDYMRKQSGSPNKKLRRLEGIAEDINNALEDGKFNPNLIKKV